MSATLYLPAGLVNRVNAYLSAEERPHDLTPELLRTFQWKVPLCSIGEQLYCALVCVYLDDNDLPYLFTQLMEADQDVTVADGGWDIFDNMGYSVLAEGDIHDTLNSDFHDFDQHGPYVEEAGQIIYDADAMRFKIISADESEALTDGLMLPRIEYELPEVDDPLNQPPHYQVNDDDAEARQSADKQELLTALSRATFILKRAIEGDISAFGNAAAAVGEFECILKRHGIEEEPEESEDE